MSVGERLVTVAVREAADPEDAAAPLADTAASSALEVVHAVGVERAPASSRQRRGGSTGRAAGGGGGGGGGVGEAGVVLRHLDGELRQASLSVLAPDPLDRLGTGRSLASDDAAP